MNVWKALLEADVQEFILENESADSHVIALRQPVFTNVPASLVMAQIAGRQKAKVKLPLYHHTKGIVYPPTLNLEQSSSEASAVFKAKFLADQFPALFSVADLSGGFGIDTYFLSSIANRTLHVEPNYELQQMAAHNHFLLGAGNITYLNTTAEHFLDERKYIFDVAYIDPSRRKENKKVFALADCEPNLVSFQESFFNQCPFLLIKAAPLLDIRAALRDIRFVKKILIVSVENECKELLFWCEKNFSGEAEINAVNLTNEGELISSYAFTFSQESEASASFNEPQSYLYEPNASILKAGAFKSIASSFGLDKLAPSTHLYTSQKLVNNFPGRIFKLIELVKPDSKSVHALLADRKANVLTRNYPLKPEELKKKLKLQDGGDAYLIGFSGTKTKYLALCSRIK